MNVRSVFVTGAAALVLAAPAAAEAVKIGVITTLTTPGGYIGADVRDALALAMQDGKLGSTPVEIVLEDDGLRPATANQAVERMLEDGVRIFTGIIFSNVLAAVQPAVMDAGGFYISNNAGPSTFAGEGCHPNYFVASWQNDVFHEIAGLAANRLGYKRMAILAPNYQAGRDALEGFKRTFEGEVLAEIYTALDQTDFSVEFARVRALAPDAIYQFHPGGAGINFAKQYDNAGLRGTIPMVIPTFSMDSQMVIATGDAAEGLYASAGWTPEMDNDLSRDFVARFRAAYGRTPTFYAQQTYDTANLIASALDKVGGDISDADAFRAALKAADFQAIRGDFRFANNNHPIQDYYITQFVRDASGGLTQVILEKVADDRVDVYAARCPLE